MKTCFLHKRWTLLFYCLSGIFSVSVSSTSAQEVLNRAVGESITFPTRVPASGTIMYVGRTIGQVLNKQTETDITEEFKNRLHWDSQSGFFTLSDLRTDDSGVYTVESTKEEKRQQAYQLNVYDKVSAPQVTNTTYNSSESKVCSLQCSVRNVRGLKLSWFKDIVILNHINSSSLNDTLNLYLEIDKFDNDTYSCVATNPVSNQTTTVNIKKLCQYSPEQSNDRKRDIVTAVVCSMTFIVAIIVMIMCLRRRKLQNELHHHREDSSATEGLNEEVQYSVINHKNHAQTNICEPASKETCQLTTIYDQIRPLDPGASVQSGSA
ncbi:SLAM family member 5-like isoform X2 [Colossoma macropomum]|uniref:SLAM family member 5-like isoform X2 n=1 Tax=Colossoma macropomum TaxID=42526 RepID=UPI001863AE16|nr:SLAM family member 5-like isoform X2 [Colossoma macropomum]